MQNYSKKMGCKRKSGKKCKKSSTFVAEIEVGLKNVKCDMTRKRKEYPILENVTITDVAAE